MDHLIALVVTTSRGCFLVKADIKEAYAYRMVPVHPQDQHLLGVQWKSADRQSVAFGLRSALKIFSAVADAVQWILGNNGIRKRLHYLDDIILVAKSLNLAERKKDILLYVFRKLNIPMEESKLERPSPCLSSLGIEVDTASFKLHLPFDKLANLKISLNDSIQCRTM